MKLQREMPSITDIGHTHSTYSGSDLQGLASTSASPFLNTWVGTGGSGGLTSIGLMGNGGGGFDHAQEQKRMYEAALRATQARQYTPPTQPTTQKGSQSAKTESVFMGRRLVQVFITDPDEKVPLESCLLYSGQQKLTDLTDNELFFEIDIRSVLDTHNAVRAKIVDKSVKDRTEFLEPTRVSKLKMVVVNVATF